MAFIQLEELVTMNASSAFVLITVTLIYMLLDSDSNTLLMTLRKNESMEMFCTMMPRNIASGHLHQLLSNSLLVGWLITPAVQHVPLCVLEVLGKLLEEILLDV